MARSERNPKPWLGALLGGVVFAAVAHAVPPSVSPPPSELEVRAECSANAESGYVVLFFESSQRQAGRRILSIGCGRGRDCTAAALRVPPDGVLRFVDLNTITASVKTLDETGATVVWGRYTFRYDSAARRVVEYVDGKHVGTVPCP